MTKYCLELYRTLKKILNMLYNNTQHSRPFSLFVKLSSMSFAVLMWPWPTGSGRRSWSHCLLTLPVRIERNINLSLSFCSKTFTFRVWNSIWKRQCNTWHKSQILKCSPIVIYLCWWKCLFNNDMYFFLFSFLKMIICNLYRPERLYLFIFYGK